MEILLKAPGNKYKGKPLILNFPTTNEYKTISNENFVKLVHLLPAKELFFTDARVVLLGGPFDEFYTGKSTESGVRVGALKHTLWLNLNIKKPQIHFPKTEICLPICFDSILHKLRFGFLLCRIGINREKTGELLKSYEKYRQHFSIFFKRDILPLLYVFQHFDFLREIFNIQTEDRVYLFAFSFSLDVLIKSILSLRSDNSLDVINSLLDFYKSEIFEKYNFLFKLLNLSLQDDILGARRQFKEIFRRILTLDLVKV